jgi:hypothetical protein
MKYNNPVKSCHMDSTALFVIFDFPDNVNASGDAKAKVTVLLTPEEIDQATKKTAEYGPSGQCSV